MRWLVLVGLLAAAPARADAVVPRHVTASLHGTHARFVVQLRVPLEADTFPAAVGELELPAGGIVTRAVARDGGVKHRLELMTSADASAAFYGLGSVSGARPPWAVLVAAGVGTVEIQIAAPAAGTADIELEIEAPTCFGHDHRSVQVPEAWRGVVHGVDEADGCSAQITGPWLRFTAPMKETRIGAIAARVSVAHADLASVEIDLARELEDVPADLATAIVVDGSRSVTADEREAQRAIIASYLRAAPHTRVQVIGYARRAQAVLPGWMTTDAGAARIDRELRALPGRNGSNIDVGLAEAGAWLARVEGTRRVIVFTDQRVPMRLESEAGDAWARLLPPGTLVHVVVLGDGKQPMQRADGVIFGDLAKLTGGIGVEASLATDVDATMLARPIALDAVEIHGDGWEPFAGCQSDGLPAGTACTWFARGTPSAGPVEVGGLLWNRPVKRVVVPDPTQARTLARDLSVMGGLDGPLQAEIDSAALAVNEVWSMFATWGGDGGYAYGLSEGGGTGTFSAIDGATIVDTIGSSEPLPKVDLLAQLAGPLAACGADAHGSIAIELTIDEIVDVAVRDAGTHTQCLEDAVWNTLVAVPAAAPRSRASISL